MQPARTLSLRHVAPAVFVLAVNTAHAATCPRTTTALTSSCGDVCFTGRPCIAYAGGSTDVCTNGKMTVCKNSTATGCAYACFKYSPTDFVENNIVDYSAFTFLIPFGSYKSSWETKWDTAEAQAANVTTLPNDTNIYPAMSDDVVAGIEPLTFLSSTKTVRIAGGTSVNGIHGRIAKADLSSQVFLSDTGILDLTLANLELKEILPSTFPPQLVNFSIINCAMSTIPNDLPTMTKLDRLDISKNYYKTYPAKFGMSDITFLNLSTNNIATFEGSFPSLITLDLSDNLLTEIPSTVFDMTNLQYLDLRQNSFMNFELTQGQIDFLANITTLHLATTGSVSCSTSAQQSIGGTTVCLKTADSESNENGGGNTGGGGSHTGAIIGGVVGGIVAVLLVALIFVLMRRRSMDNMSHTQTPGGSTKNSGQSSESVNSLWTDQELMSLKLNNDDIEDIRRIGSGAFSIVYLVQYRQTRLAAAKRLKKDELSWQNTQLFVSEIKLVQRLEHPRIVSLIGVAWTIESDLQALFEYMESGDMRTYLESMSTPRRWSREKVQIMVDVIEALVYVHSFTPPLMHRDLKSRNVLLNKENRAKLSDFGVARFRSEHATMTTGVGTGRWLAPEVISGSNDYDQACDIFAFGVVMSELDTHELPYEDIRGPSGNRLADVALMQMVSQGKLVPTFSRACPSEILKLASRCLAFESASRPTAVEVAYALRTIMRSDERYLF